MYIFYKVLISSFKVVEVVSDFNLGFYLGNYFFYIREWKIKEVKWVFLFRFFRWLGWFGL